MESERLLGGLIHEDQLALQIHRHCQQPTFNQGCELHKLGSEVVDDLPVKDGLLNVFHFDFQFQSFMVPQYAKPP